LVIDEKRPKNCMECPKNSDNCTLCNPVIAEGEEFIHKYGHGIVSPSFSSQHEATEYWKQISIELQNIRKTATN